ncbi:hypothetical protein F5B22DRAFT_645663 [Xylaria bambusicola]|uniref:uncharacterized protein n=1 Tax=Xylaria bambusicola TaxID=326684 RepID=UPI0020076868|nr:uncharacterized protein F5B22DRAFT_645663 [Xylaria bambusicola]KAI0517482.1 hypothetical protein F5B22DRAFT_645663 [Xylaria bambusicola]
MFGTLRLAPNSETVDFIERTDGRSFTGTVPPHSACTHCRSKKLRCGGQKPICNRCKTSSTKCVYAPAAGRRRAHSGKKRSHDGGVVHESNSAAEDLSQTDMTISNPPSAAERVPPVTSSNVTTEGTSETTCQGLTSDSPTTCLDSESLNEALEHQLSSHSIDSEFHFNTETTIGAIDKPTHVIGSDAEIVRDSLIATDFTAGLTALWSIPASFTDGQGFATSPRLDSFGSMMATTNTVAPVSFELASNSEPENRLGGGAQCARQCLSTTTPLLEQIDNLTHSMAPDNLERVLSWHTQACNKCLQVLKCESCYSSSEQMMLILMLCDKLIMLTKKLLWHTLDETQFEGAFRVREYESTDPSEFIGIIRLLCSNRVRDIARLLARIEDSPAVAGKQVQLIMIRNMEQQVAKTLGGIRECLGSFIG